MNKKTWLRILVPVMIVAIAGGLLGATLLTLIVLPVMYAAWYRVTPGPSSAADGQAAEALPRN